MAGSAVANHIFGIRQNVANAVLFQDEHTLLIPGAGQLIRYRLDGLPQKFIQPQQASAQGNSTALAISANRRYLAVAEAFNHQNGSIQQPHIIIYDLLNDNSKRQRILTMPPEMQFNEIVSLDFSPDGKFLIAQGGRPDWMLCMWLWEKSKLLSTIKSTNPAGNPVTKISFNPSDSTQICVTGQNVFKFLRYTEGHLKQHGTQKVDPKNYTSHAWLSNDRMALTCDNNKVYILENGDIKDSINLYKTDLAANMNDTNTHLSTEEFKTHMTSRQNTNLEEGQLAAVTVTPVGNGFAVSNNNGITFLYEAEEAKGAENYYRLVKRIRFPESSLQDDDFVQHMVASPVNEFLVGMTAQRGLYQFSLATAHLESKLECAWEELGAGSHSGVIGDMSICSRKPLIASCSTDNILKIWNYETHECEISKKFAEEICSLSLHPSGLHVLIGFSDKLRLMNLLIDDVRMFKEFSVRGVRLSSFSNGGHLFAAVYGMVGENSAIEI